MPEQELDAAVAVHEESGTVAVRGRRGRRCRGTTVQVHEEQQRREQCGIADCSVVSGNAQGRGRRAGGTRGWIEADSGAAPESGAGQVESGAGARGRLRVVRLRGQRGRVGRSAFAGRPQPVGRVAGRAVPGVVRGGLAGRRLLRPRRAPDSVHRRRPSDRVQVRRTYIRRQTVRRTQLEHVQH